MESDFFGVINPKNIKHKRAIDIEVHSKTKKIKTGVIKIRNITGIYHTDQRHVLSFESRQRLKI